MTQPLEFTLRIVGAGIVLCSLLVVIDRTVRRASDSAFPRKLAHILCGLIILPLPAILGRAGIEVLGIAFIPGLLFSRHFNLLPTLHESEQSSFGEIAYPAGIVLLTGAGLSVQAWEYGICAMCFADPIAALVGRKYGRHQFKTLGAVKSLEGAGACALACWIAATFISGNPAFAFVTAGVAIGSSLVESLIGFGLDNLVLPLAAGLLFALLVR